MRITRNRVDSINGRSLLQVSPRVHWQIRFGS